MTDPSKKFRHLPVKLTEEELKQRAAHLAECVDKRATIAAARSAATSLAYRENKENDGQIARLGAIVRTGTETREVEVVERKDLANRVLNVIRKDTNEVVESRPLEIAELQDELPWDRQAGERTVSHVAKDDDEDQDEDDAPAKPAKRGSPKNRGKRAEA